MMKLTLYIALYAACPLLLAETPIETLRQSKPKMGSPFEIAVVHRDAAIAQRAMAAAWAEIDRLEAMISSWRESSETSAVNRAAGERPVQVSPELFNLIRRSVKVSVLSDGAFDITFASAGRYWNLESGVLPDPSDVQKAVEAIDYNHIILDPEHRTVFLKDPQTQIGLGAIGKGFAANRAMAVLKQYGVQGALINAGGDIVAGGSQADGRPWRIAIADPRRKGSLIAHMDLTETAVVTSGDYERFMMVDGVRYSHILDPRSGYPVTGTISVTVICPDGELADALATAVFVLGPQAGMALVDSLKGVEAILIDDLGNIVYSKNIVDQLDFEADGPGQMAGEIGN